MPPRPLRPCKNLVCPKTTRSVSGYCEICEPDALLKKKIEERQKDQKRGTAAQRGYDGRWRRERQEFLRATVLRQRLREYPCCETCLANGKITQATVVDHIIPHRGNYELMWDRENWAALCGSCHNVKTAKEDGAFGNPRK